MTAAQDTEQFLEIQNVRITPSKLVLRSACDSKNVVGKFTIQNVGKKMTFIRIAPPNVKECLLECMIRGTQLSPGLQIVRVVKFIEGFTPNITCVIPIYINDERYDYEVEIDVFEASITIYPLSIDVGCIQLGTICSVQSIFVENGGNQKVFCYTDVGRTSAAVFILDPKKSDIMEIKIATSLHVKAGGTFKTVRITGSVTPSKLEAIHVNATENFTFIEFPATYFGLTSYENLIVRNRSILRNLFSTMGEEYGSLIAIGRHKADESDFSSFNAYPLDGIFEPNETKIFKFTFTPHTRCGGKNTINEFFFCTMRIKKFRGHVFELTESASQFFDTKEEAFDDYKYSTAATTAFPFCGLTESMVHTRSAETFYNLSKNPEEDFIRVYLYGTAEHPSVDVVPDELIDFDIPYNTKLSRVLQLKNNSNVLPIIVHYKKTAFVHVKPANVFLKPQESLQVIVHVTPKTLGKIESKIVFHLLYHNNSKEEVILQVIGHVAVPLSVNVLSCGFPTFPKPQLNTGLSPNYIKDVGKYCQGVRFNTSIPKLKCITVYNCTVIDKNCQDLVAFPNDTQQSLRPSRLEDRCRTLFARKPRYIQPIDTGYELTQFDNMFKREVSQYYTKYMRSVFTNRHKDFLHASGYSLTDKRQNLCTDIRCLAERPIKEEFKKHCCIPLTPIEMEHIIVNPVLVNTGQIVVSDIYPFSINIRNNNSFAIRIFVKSDKMNISSVNGKRHVVGEMDELTINFICRFMYLGHNNSTIELIMNESMAIDIPVFSEVVNKYLVPSCFELNLCDGNNPLYVDLSNTLSVPVSFQWTLSSADFGITPMTGTVRPKKSITCTVHYFHGMNATSECDAYIQSSAESVELITLTAKFKKKSLTVPEDGVMFKDLSLNIPRFQSVIIRNPSDIPLMFSISQNDFEDYITIMPQRGTLEKFCSSALFLTAKFTNCGIFDGHIQIKTQSDVINLRIYGNVVYPNIDINPRALIIPKICGSTTTKIPFVITNKSVSAVTVRFMMQEFEMFRVSTSASVTKPVETDEVVLDSHSSQRFYLHFMPSGALAYFFYLPIVINGILGPPIYADVVSTKVLYYLNESIPESTIVRTPVCIPCVKIQCLSLPQKIVLLKTMIKIVTCPKRYQDHFVLKIRNPQIDEESVCLRIDDLKSPFEIDYTDENILRSDCSIVCNLKPDETISLIIYFKPSEFDFGSYRALIPVYIRSDHSAEPHRFIRVLGIYQKPEINMEMNTDIDLKKDYQSDAYMNYVPMSAPIDLPLVSTKKVTFRNHLSNCEIDINVALVDELSVTVDHESKQYIDDDTYTIQVVIAWTPKIQKVFCFQWKITCTCGGFWQQLGCNIIESSFMTMPAFCSKYFSMYSKGNYNLAKNITTSIDMIYPQYPFFKTNDPDTNALFELSLTVIETWLYSQIFYGVYNYQIPNDICHVDYRPVPEHLLKRNVRMSMCPLAQILITLVGPKAFELFDLRDGMFPDSLTDVDQIDYLQEIYFKIIQFVGEKGGSFTYLQPEYLFPYNLYKLYRERIYNQLTPPFQLTEYVIEFDDFTSLACRSWFDVILQIYKVFVLNKIYNEFKKTKPPLNPSSSSIITPMTKFESFEHVNKYPLFLSESESFLLNWFEFMFNSYKDEIWGISLNCREVGLFDESLKDGVVFATVTLAHCPYMKPFLENIYLDACTYEEMLHNAILVERCWKTLNFNFRINPTALVTAHSLGDIMQMAYLYETLPFSYPIEEIVFEAPLSKHVKRHVILTNTNSFLIAYKPILLSEDGCFNINEEVFEIKPKKSKTITVSYFAKFCTDTEGTLLFSGEVSGYRYAKNKCVTLLGKPDLAYATTIIKYPLHLYSVPDFTFTIKSPYQQAATYQLKVALDDPLSREKLPNALFYHERHRLACSLIMLTNASFDFDQDGVCVLTGYLIPIATYNTTAWLYFTNKTVGDFAIKLITIMKDCVEYELLTVTIPANFTQKHKSKLKKKLYVEIPYRNKALWKTIRMMLFRITTGDEKAFWNRMIDTTTGTNLLHRIMFISIPKGKLENTFVCTSGEYDVAIPHAHRHAISLPYVLTFPDECSPSTLKVPITVKDEKAIPDHTIMSLYCEKLFRKRTYMLYFDKATIPQPKDFP